MKATLVEYGLSRSETVQALADIRRQLATANADDFTRSLASYLHLYEFDFRTSDAAVRLSSTLQLIGTIVRDPDFLVEQQRFLDASPPHVHYSTRLPRAAQDWGKGFIKQFLREIRSIVCGKGKEYARLRKELGSYPKAFAVAASATVLNLVGINGPAALGLSTLLLLALAQATHNAFCKMTDEAVLIQIEKRLQEEEERDRAVLDKSRDASSREST